MPTSAPDRFGSPAIQAVLVGVCVAVAYLLLRTSQMVALGAFGDDGVYVALGQALATGKGYHSIYAAGSPVHIKYPPGLPALFSLVWRSAGGSLPTVQALLGLLSVIVSGLSAGLVWWYGRVRLELSVPLLAVFGIGPFLFEGSLQFFNLAISESYFLLIWLGVLLTAARLPELESSEEPQKRGAVQRTAVALGALVALGVLTRTQGIVLLPALLAAMAVDHIKLRTAALFGTVAILPLVAWNIWHARMLVAGPVSTQPDEASYLDWVPLTSPGEMVPFLRRTLGSNIPQYWATGVGNLADPPWLGAILAVLLLTLFAVGAVAVARRQPALVLTVLATMAVIAIWPYAQDRFLVLLLPLAGLLAATGLERLLTTFEGGGGPRRLAHGVLALVVVAVGVRQTRIRARGYDVEEASTPLGIPYPFEYLAGNTRFILSAAHWVQENTDPTDRLLTPNPAAFFLYTGRQAVNSSPAQRDIGPSVFAVPGRYLASRVESDGVDIVILANPSMALAADIAAVQKACPETLRYMGLAQGWSQAAFWRVEGDGSCLREHFPVQDRD